MTVVYASLESAIVHASSVRLALIITRPRLLWLYITAYRPWRVDDDVRHKHSGCWLRALSQERLSHAAVKSDAERRL